MTWRLQGITIGLLVGVTIASVHAGEQVGLDSLGPAQYSVVVSGAVSAEGSALPAGDGDTGITDEQLRGREVSERALYTGDRFYKPASGADEPFELTFSLRPDYVTVDGMEQPSLSVRLHFAEGIGPEDELPGYEPFARITLSEVPGRCANSNREPIPAPYRAVRAARRAAGRDRQYGV